MIYGKLTPVKKSVTTSNLLPIVLRKQELLGEDDVTMEVFREAITENYGLPKSQVKIFGQKFPQVVIGYLKDGQSLMLSEDFFISVNAYLPYLPAKSLAEELASLTGIGSSVMENILSDIPNLARELCRLGKSFHFYGFGRFSPSSSNISPNKVTFYATGELTKACKSHGKRVSAGYLYGG